MINGGPRVLGKTIISKLARLMLLGTLLAQKQSIRFAIEPFEFSFLLAATVTVASVRI